MVTRRSGLGPFRAAIALTGVLLGGLPASGQVWEVRNRMISDPTDIQVEAQFGSMVAAGDFDGDGYRDLVAGSPWRDYTTPPWSIPDAGYLAVWRGGSSGLAADWQLRLQGLLDEARLGQTCVAGDFDANGRDEMAYGSPGRSNGADEQVGRVFIDEYVGSNWVLHSSWGEGEVGVPGAAEPFDQFGSSLVVGNFNGDAYHDLAIGVPSENIESPSLALDAGAIVILYGGPSGLTAAGAQSFSEATGSLGGAVANAEFGFALAAGDFDGDDYGDLAVGAPFRTVGGVDEAGQVVILFGTPTGLTTAGHQRLSDSTFGGAIETGDHFGYALAAADYTFSLVCFVLDSCYSDLAIGVPGQLDFGFSESGHVIVAYGSASGIPSAGVQHLYQDVLGAAGGSSPEAYDHFGSNLVAGSLDARLGADLVIGVPDEDVASDVDQGMIHLVFGGASGLMSYPGQWRRQDGFASGPGAAGDRFGAALAIGDFDGDSMGDLAVGVPGRNRFAVENSGVVQILYGALFADGFESGGTSNWTSLDPE